MIWGSLREISEELDIPSTFFKELEGLLGHVWPSITLEKHYSIRELVPALVLDGGFEPQYRVASTVQFG